MQYRRIIVLAAAALLSGCGSITLPAAVKMQNGEVLTGTTTAAMSGGTFQVKSPTGALVCGGNYDAFDTRPVITAPVTCNDGRYGTITIIRDPSGQSGSGNVVLASGETGNAGFGRAASTVFSTPAPATVYTPPIQPARSTSRTSSYRTYYLGPRGGCYYLTASGNKQYVDRSLCH